MLNNCLPVNKFALKNDFPYLPEQNYMQSSPCTQYNRDDTLCIWSTAQNNRIISFVIVSSLHYDKRFIFGLQTLKMFCIESETESNILFSKIRFFGARDSRCCCTYYGITRNMDTPVASYIRIITKYVR